MRELKRRAGFTLVEVIVVVAIIGIMLAAALPMLNTTDGMKSEAADYAKSFYYNVQSLISEEKFANNPLTDKSYVLLKVEVTYDETGKGTGDYVDTDIEITAVDTSAELAVMTPIDDYKATGTSVEGRFTEFGNSLDKLLSVAEKSCVYLALIDSKYRVKETYCYVGSFDEMTSASFQFSAERIMGDKFAASYPVDKDLENAVMFSDYITLSYNVPKS